MSVIGHLNGEDVSLLVRIGTRLPDRSHVPGTYFRNRRFSGVIVEGIPSRINYEAGARFRLP
jgi:hypothetical protein